MDMNNYLKLLLLFLTCIYIKIHKAFTLNPGNIYILFYSGKPFQDEERIEFIAQNL